MSAKRKELLAIAFLAVAAAPARGTDPPESRLFDHDDGDGNTISYRVFPPPDIDPALKYPLVLYLHGCWMHAVQDLDELTSVIGGLMAATQTDEWKSYLVVPQASPSPGTDWYLQRSIALVIEILDEVESRYPIDQRRLYVTGQSMGGIGTYALFYYQPGRFAAGVPVSGGVRDSDLGRVSAALKDIPLWIFHGALDDVIPVDRGRTMVQALQDAGGAACYTEYPDQDHGNAMYRRVYSEESRELYSWLFGQRIRRGPKATFKALPERGEIPLEVRFDAGASTAGDDAAILRFSWDFGDGASAEGATPCHTYTQAGCYRVKLRVANELGLEDRTTGTIEASCGCGLDISDAVAILGHLLLGEEKVAGDQGDDANDDGALDVLDAVYISILFFVGGMPIEPPDGNLRG
jgi:predicted esterase